MEYTKKELMGSGFKFSQGIVDGEPCNDAYAFFDYGKGQFIAMKRYLPTEGSYLLHAARDSSGKSFDYDTIDRFLDRLDSNVLVKPSLENLLELIR